MKLFLEHMIKPPIKEHIVSAILNQVQTEREGFAINRSAVKGCVEILLQLHYDYDGPTVYKQIVEPAVLKDSLAYYRTEGETLLQTCDAPEYLRKVGSLFDTCHIATASFRWKTVLPMRKHAPTTTCRLRLRLL